MKTLISKMFAKVSERGWNRTYWAIDIHDTILKGNYSVEMPVEFLPGAREALRHLSSRRDCCLILYTCSHADDIKRYLDFFETHGIFFMYANCNPEISDTKLANFTGKLYFNILLEDKAGFDGERHWTEILETMKTIPELK